LLWLAVASYRRPRHDTHEGLILKAIERQATPPKPAAVEKAFFWPSPDYLPELAALMYVKYVFTSLIVIPTLPDTLVAPDFF
jgi:hypothetical protein